MMAKEKQYLRELEKGRQHMRICRKWNRRRKNGWM